MKLLLALLLSSIRLLSISANDTLKIKGFFYNKEFNVYINIDFEKKDIVIPNQEIYGKLAGYLGSDADNRKWLFTDIRKLSNTTYEINIINDYGTEDLLAEIKFERKKECTLLQKRGSYMKIVINRKWVKLPKKITFYGRTK